MRFLILLALLAAPALAEDVEAETLAHFQAIVRMDTSDPPGGEKPVVDYLKKVLEQEGIPVETFALEPHRPNLVARLKGSGAKRPLLLMGHTDVVNVDPKKWKFPPWSAARDGGHIYGRGTVDDKDNVIANMMTLILLKRRGVKLDRDVIFLAEAGEEGSTKIGIQYMVREHFDKIDAEFCLAEGGGLSRRDGKVRFASVQAVEKIPYAIDLEAKGVSGHGSVPHGNQAVVHLAAAVAAVGAWKAPLRMHPVVKAYFERLATVSTPADAARYEKVAKGTDAERAEVDRYFQDQEARHAAVLRTSIAPTIIKGGYRINVIPSEAKAELDVRLLPDEDPPKFLEMVKQVVNDPAVTVKWGDRDTRPGSPTANLDSEAFRAIEAAVKAVYDVPAIPTMSTGATDMAYLRAKGIQCFGIGPATDFEDAAKGFGAHSDQERILEAELHRFVRYTCDVVVRLAAKR